MPKTAISDVSWQGIPVSSHQPKQKVPNADSIGSQTCHTAAFLENALRDLGLTRKEANEFIVYWLPQMQENPYNLIAFQSDCYTQVAQLDISPAPDTLLRVFMAWKPLEEKVDIPAQTLTAPARDGFTAVEWGGSRIN